MSTGKKSYIIVILTKVKNEKDGNHLVRLKQLMIEETSLNPIFFCVILAECGLALS